MKKRYALLLLVIATLILMIGFPAVGSNDDSLAVACCDGGVVDKAPCEAFTVKITFQNTGTTIGAWSINIAFEGESWSWSGTAQNLTLKPCRRKTLTWDGSVPCDAPIGSTARLVVYHNDSFTPLNWWIHVVSGAELAITSSTVE